MVAKTNDFLLIWYAPRQRLHLRPRPSRTLPDTRSATARPSLRAAGPPQVTWGDYVTTLMDLEQPSITVRIVETMAAAAMAAIAATAWPPRNNAQITVRRAMEADFEGVAGIRGIVIPVGMSGATGFLGGKVVIDDPEEARRRELMSKVADLVSREAVALIALERGVIVGTVDCITQTSEKRPTERTEGGKSTPRSRVFLKNLFVLPEHRRRGVARQLVKGAEELARREKGVEALSLEVARKNAPARGLYLACGFEEEKSPFPRENGWGRALSESLGIGKLNMVKRI